MSAEDTCRLAAELSDEYGDVAVLVAQRTIASLEADGCDQRASVWRALLAILDDIAAKRIDPYAKIAIH
ncbi:MAG TPA: hypothetical protein VHT51_03475 [Micropepsaceae bacterium]|jgi:hypothetical protein|nr:hypothetical protein [Micropepsaceae bacterium]